MEGQIAWLGGVLIAACLLMAVWFLRESGIPVYLQDAAPIVDAWEIVPGKGIGPLQLGPLGYDAIQLLRKSVVIVQQGMTATCLMRHSDGWTAAVTRTGEPAPDDHPPVPMEFVSVERIVTTSSARLTPDSVRVGSPLPDAAAMLGAPEEISKPPSPARRVLRWPDGLEAGLEQNCIAWFGVSGHVGAGS